MKHQNRYITSEEYQKTIIPAAGMVLIEKDGISEHYGDILLTKNTVKLTLAHAATAIILRMSPFECESDHDNYLNSIYKVGDRVGVNSETPVLSPAPPYWTIRNSDPEDHDGTYMIHVADILGVVLETEEKRAEFYERVKMAYKKETKDA